MYLPTYTTIDETCDWLEHRTNETWTLARLLEVGQLVPHFWIDYVTGYPQIFGDRLEGYLSKMLFHGDVMRLAADRADAKVTMFTAHDGTLVRMQPAWLVKLKHIRFIRQDVERVAETINGGKLDAAAPPEPVESTTQRQDRRLALFRTQGGSAKFLGGKWKLTGISKLVAHEREKGSQRASEKTIRADLHGALETESRSKRTGDSAPRRSTWDV